MILHRYFARRFIIVFLAVFTVFMGMFVLLDMVEQIRKFDADTIGFVEILKLTLLNVPQGLYRILPLIMILATVTLFLALARSSELVVTRASGRSALRALVAPVTVALLIGVFAVAVLNPIVAATSKQYEIQSDLLLQGVTNNTTSLSREGLWLRQGGPEGQTVIRALRSNLDGTQLFSVSFFGFGPDGGPRLRVEAASATLTEGAWLLTDAKEWRYDQGDNPERDAKLTASLRIASNLTVDQIRDSFGAPTSIPIWELASFINRLENAGFSARAHRVWLQMELALPLMMAAMVLIGAVFTMRHTRFGRTGTMVLSALLLGFAMYFIRNFAQILGESGQIPVLLAAWSPPFAAILLSLGILLNLEDG